MHLCGIYVEHVVRHKQCSTHELQLISKSTAVATALHELNLHANQGCNFNAAMCGCHCDTFMKPGVVTYNA